METGQWNLKTQHPDPNGQFVKSFSEPKKVKTFLNAFKYTANTNIKNCYKSSFIKTKFKFYFIIFVFVNIFYDNQRLDQANVFESGQDPDLHH